MIRDPAAQDRPLPARRPQRRSVLIAAAVAVIAALAFAWPKLQQALGTNTAVSATRLVVAEIERGSFVRDIAAEGKVVAAVSPTLYAPSAGAVILKVRAGDSVNQGQVLATVESPEL